MVTPISLHWASGASLSVRGFPISPSGHQPGWHIGKIGENKTVNKSFQEWSSHFPDKEVLRPQGVGRSGEVGWGSGDLLLETEVELG